MFSVANNTFTYGELSSLLQIADMKALQERGGRYLALKTALEELFRDHTLDAHTLSSLVALFEGYPEENSLIVRFIGAAKENPQRSLQL